MIVLTPHWQVDPDIQFYPSVQYIQSTTCDYYSEDKFISIIAEGNKRARNLSFFHINIKSLPKHYDGFEIYLNSLTFKFSFIALSETWFDEYKQGLYELPNYTSINEFRTNKKGGGVLLYIADYLKFKHRHELECFDSEMEPCSLKLKGECLILNVTWSLEYYIECPMLVLMFLMKECVTFWILFKRDEKFAIFLVIWISIFSNVKITSPWRHF